MSIRAALISRVMARTIRPLFDSVADITGFRDKLAKAAGLNTGVPKGVDVTSEAIAGVPCEWVQVQSGRAASDSARVLLYLHGGGYVSGGADSHRNLAWRLAQASGMAVLMVEYRLAPEHPFPAGLDDATLCYRSLLDQGFNPENIAIGGDSAGGGLALALLLNLKNLGLPMPAKAILLSPWLDLSLTGDSLGTNIVTDVMLTPKALQTCAGFYLGQRDPEAPLASPLFGDLKGLPPLLVHASSSELLLSDSTRLVTAVEAQGGAIELTVWPKMPHVFQVFAGRIPEGNEAIRQLGAFLDTRPH